MFAGIDSVSPKENCFQTKENEQRLEPKTVSDLPEKQLKDCVHIIVDAETNLAAARELLSSLLGDEPEVIASVKEEQSGKIIEGVFDGQNMVGSDAKTYPVPANTLASQSSSREISSNHIC